MSGTILITSPEGNCRQSGAKTVNTHLPNRETEVQQTASNVGVLLLTVLNATAEDSSFSDFHDCDEFLLMYRK